MKALFVSTLLIGWSTEIPHMCPFVFCRNSKLTHLLQDSLGTVNFFSLDTLGCARFVVHNKIWTASAVDHTFGNESLTRNFPGLCRRRFENTDVCTNKPERGGCERDSVLVEFR